MRKMVEKLLNQNGREVQVAGMRVRAVFQSVTGKLERLVQLEPGPLGLHSHQRYLYIGPVEPELGLDMELTAEGKDYLVRSAHRIHGGNGPVYSWAICVEKGRVADEP